MTVRPVFHGQIGSELRELREARGWSQHQTVSLAKRRKLPPLSVQKLRYLEEGRTKHPDAEVLRALSALYGVNYDELVARFIVAIYGFGAARAATTETIHGPLAGNWRLLQDDERQLLDAWRAATPEGRQAALAVLHVSKGPGQRTRRKASTRGNGVAADKRKAHPTRR